MVKTTGPPGATSFPSTHLYTIMSGTGWRKTAPIQFPSGWKSQAAMSIQGWMSKGLKSRVKYPWSSVWVSGEGAPSSQISPRIVAG